jgi:two-component system CheB/CheR fusion protein
MTDAGAQAPAVDPSAVIAVLVADLQPDPAARLEPFLMLLDLCPRSRGVSFIVLADDPTLRDLITAGVRWRRSDFAVVPLDWSQPGAGPVPLRPRTVYLASTATGARITRNEIGPGTTTGAARQANELLESLAEQFGPCAGAFVLGGVAWDEATERLDRRGGIVARVTGGPEGARQAVAALLASLGRCQPGRVAHPEARSHDAEMPGTATDLRRILRGLDQSLVMLGPDCTISMFTPAATQHFDLMARDIGRPLAHFAGRIVDPKLAEDLDEARRSGLPVARDVRAVSGHWFSRRIDPLVEPDGSCAGLILTHRDVSERRRVAGALALAERRAREAETEVRRVFGLFGNDLAVAIQTALISLDLMVGESAAADRARLRDGAEEVLGMLARSVESILAVQRIDAGVLRPDPVAVSAQAVLGAVCAELRGQAELRGIALRLMPTRARIVGDPVLLGHLLRHLVQGALELHPGGRIVVGCRPQGARVRIVVAAQADAGADPAAVAQGGGGQSAAWIVRRLGASLGLAAHVDPDGSMRWIEAPRADAAALDESPAVDATAGMAAAEAGATPSAQGAAARIVGARVLVIEPDAPLRKGFKKLLRTQGCEAIGADGLESARRLMRTDVGPVDLVMSALPPDAATTLAAFLDGLRPRATGQGVPVLIGRPGAAEGVAPLAAGRKVVTLTRPAPARTIAALVQEILHDDDDPPLAEASAGAARTLATADPPEADSLRITAAPVIAIIAEDAAFRTLLGADLAAAGCGVVGHDGGEAFLADPDRAACDAVVIDCMSADHDGAEALGILTEGENTVPVLLLTGQTRIEGVVAAIRAGACDVIVKPATAAEIVARVRGCIAEKCAADRQSAGRDGAGFAPRDGRRLDGGAERPVAARLRSDLPLTDRQRAVLEAVLEGHPSKVIAHRLGISQRTVESHRSAIMRAYGARSLTDLVWRVLAPATDTEAGEAAAAFRSGSAPGAPPHS